VSAVLRCERCGARAKVELIVPVGDGLAAFALCMHHFAEQRRKGLPHGSIVTPIRQEEIA
jgi:hypothetical protein